MIQGKVAIEEALALKKRGIDLISNTHSYECVSGGAQLVFVYERNKNQEVVRHEARLVAHGLTQRPFIV